MVQLKEHMVCYCKRPVMHSSPSTIRQANDTQHKISMCQEIYPPLREVFELRSEPPQGETSDFPASLCQFALITFAVFT